MLALMEGRNHADTIQKVRLFMEQNSSNPDLSLNYLSERFNMNWKTLSKLFRETGQKFVDYLMSADEPCPEGARGDHRLYKISRPKLGIPMPSRLAGCLKADGVSPGITVSRAYKRELRELTILLTASCVLNQVENPSDQVMHI